jgi:hypothetical protein
MSEEREKKFETEDATAPDDVEAHVKAKLANDEGEDGGDDVEAHVKEGRHT